MIGAQAELYRKDMNVLYLYVKNELRISVDSLSSQEYAIQRDTQLVKISRNDQGKYVVYPRSRKALKSGVTLNVLHQGERVQTRFYRVEKFPTPSVSIKAGHLIDPLFNICQGREFYRIINNSPLDIEFEVLNCSMTWKRPIKEVDSTYDITLLDSALIKIEDLPKLKFCNEVRRGDKVNFYQFNLYSKATDTISSYTNNYMEIE